MVDWAPWGGDYIGTRVEHNQITADGDSFKIGIAIGPAVWGDDVDSVRLSPLQPLVAPCRRRS